MSEHVPLTTIVKPIDYVHVFNDILALDLTQCTVNVFLAAVIKNESVPRFERLQISDTLMEGFCEIVEKKLKHYKGKLGMNDILFREYVSESQPDDYDIEHFDLTTYPLLLEQLTPLQSPIDLELFAGEEPFISHIRFYVIALQPFDNSDPVYFFRTTSPAKMLLGRSRFLGAIWDKNAYKLVQEPLLLFDTEVDCMSRCGMMYVFRKTDFQNAFQFFETIQRTATETLTIIKARIPIHNIEDFTQTCMSDLNKLRKLNTIAKKPYFDRITMDDIKKVLEQNKTLEIEIAVVEGKEHLVYNAKAKDKWVILKLLGDNYLKSVMTNNNYEVTGKREL